MTDYREICAALADAVYGDESAQGKPNHELSIPSGWQMIDLNWYHEDLNGDDIINELDIKHYETDANGFTAAAYTDGNDIVISFRGTDGLADFVTSNGLMGLDHLPDQYSNALAFYNEIKAANPTANITLTGHSLGGALAQLVGATLQKNGDSKYAGAYTYNAPGVGHLLSDLGISQSPSFFTKIQNYVNMSDLVGNIANAGGMGDHLGATYYIAPTATSTDDTFYSHGQYFDAPLAIQPTGWTGKYGMALWYYDVNKNINPLADN